MRAIAEIYKVAQPTLLQRRYNPIEAMESWNRVGWARWLEYGIEYMHVEDGTRSMVVFAPLLIDPKECNGEEQPGLSHRLFDFLRASGRSDAAMLRMEDGLTDCIRGMTWGSQTNRICFLTVLAGYAATAAPREALAEFFQKPHDTRELKGREALADAIAFVLSRHPGQFNTEIFVAGDLQPLLRSFQDPALRVAAAYAALEPDTYVPHLRLLAPEIFNPSVSPSSWRSAVNLLIEFAGAEKALCAAEGSGDDAKTVRSALRVFGGISPKGCEQ